MTLDEVINLLALEWQRPSPEGLLLRLDAYRAALRPIAARLAALEAVAAAARNLRDSVANAEWPGWSGVNSALAALEEG
jgi:DNA-binding FadR family transcriptional regulator